MSAGRRFLHRLQCGPLDLSYAPSRKHADRIKVAPQRYVRPYDAACLLQINFVIDLQHICARRRHVREDVPRVAGSTPTAGSISNSLRRSSGLEGPALLEFGRDLRQPRLI
jgi:hypothetical protein